MIQTIVFSTTDKCPIHCDFCGLNCDPKNSNVLDFQWMKSKIDDVYAWGILEQVIFTGGEPMLLGDTIVELIEYCSKKKLLTRIVSNAFWAKTSKKTKLIIKSLKRAGLTEINFSVDDFHQEYIPMANIKYAVDACVEYELPVLIAHKEMPNTKISKEYIEAKLGRKLPFFKRDDHEKHPVVISSGWTVPIGKGSKNITEKEWKPHNWKDHVDNWKHPCKSVLEQLVLTHDKKLSICCGIIQPHIKEIVFDIEEGHLAETIEQANSDLLTNWLSLEGPYGIMKFIKKKDPSIIFNDYYVQACHLCNDIFSRTETRKILEDHLDEYSSVIEFKRSTLEYCRNRIINSID